MKIYDCFMFFDEFELLDLRVHLMGPYIDYFILVESPYSNTGISKPLYFKERMNEFDNSKIRNLVSDYKFNSNDTARDRESYQRNYITKGLYDAEPDDIIIVSDLDEIPNPETLINNLHQLEVNNIFSLKQKLFYFYINLLQKSTWRGPAVSKFKHMGSPQKMRNRRYRNPVSDGGWHYSYLGGVDKVKEKIIRLCDTQFNIDEYKNVNHIKNCMETGADIFNREKLRKKNLKTIELEGNSPSCIHEFIKKYPEVIKINI